MARGQSTGALLPAAPVSLSLRCCRAQARCCPSLGPEVSPTHPSSGLARGQFSSRAVRVASRWQLGGKQVRVSEARPGFSVAFSDSRNGFPIPILAVCVDSFPPVPGRGSLDPKSQLPWDLSSQHHVPPFRIPTLCVLWLWSQIPDTGLSFALQIWRSALPYHPPCASTAPYALLAKVCIPPEPSAWAPPRVTRKKMKSTDSGGQSGGT